MHPRHNRETFSPADPSFTYSICRRYQEEPRKESLEAEKRSTILDGLSNWPFCRQPACGFGANRGNSLRLETIAWQPAPGPTGKTQPARRERCGYQVIFATNCMRRGEFACACHLPKLALAMVVPPPSGPN